jgi:molecular chaperone GrpE (heat shock protein)
MTKFNAIALAALMASMVPSQAFVVPKSHHLQSTLLLSSPTFYKPNSYAKKVILFAETNSSEEGEAESVEAEVTDEEPKEAEATEEEAVPPTEEDKEIAAIKANIAELENTLKNKNRELNSLLKMADQYSEGGYARKVAEMESFRRNKRAASADNKTVARAAVLTDFLPIMEELNGLVARYEGNEFAQKYRALSSDFNKALGDMGVEGFTINEGAAVDGVRCIAVQEEFSDTVPKDCVIRVAAFGYELEGNVMRPVNAVVSKGPEGSME